MAVSSTRRGLATKAVRRAGARMALSLLGTNNPKHNLIMADHLLTISARDFAKKWNFDPIKEVPLATGRYDWCSGPHAAPHAHAAHAHAAHAHAAHDPHNLRTCLALPTADLRHSQGGVGDLSAHAHTHEHAHVHTHIHAHVHTHAHIHTHTQAHAHGNSQSSTSSNQRHLTAINTPETEESLEVKEVYTAPEGDGASTRASTSATPSTTSASTSAKGKQEASATTAGAVGTEEQAEARPTTSAKKHKEEHVTKIEFGTEEKAEARPKAGASGEKGAPGPQGGAGTVPQAQGTSAATPPVPTPERSATGEAEDTSTTLPRRPTTPTTRQTCITEYVRPRRSSKSSSRDPDHTSQSKKRSASTLKDHLHQPPHKKVLLQIRA